MSIMVRKTYLGLFFAFILIALTGASSSLAQEASQEELPGRNVASNLLTSINYKVALVRRPDLAPNIAVLRITEPLSLNGCIKEPKLDVETRTYAPIFEVKMLPPVVEMGESRHGAHCNHFASTLSSDVLLDRDQLIADEITTIVFKNDFGQDRYTVSVNEFKLDLAPRSETIFKPESSSKKFAPLTHWFYPARTIILSAPQANTDVTTQIKAFATKRGMAEVHAFMPGFEQNPDEQNTLYFVDQVGTIANALKPEEHKVIAQAADSQTLFGPEGAYEASKTVNIEARLPGTSE